MKFSFLTLFPALIEEYFATSIIAKAVERRLFDYAVVNIRDFAQDAYRSCDDAPYGGGAGMVMKAEPLAAALQSVEKGRVILPTPVGRPFCQSRAKDLAVCEHLILVCARYEGVDQRFIDRYVEEEISLGDYVLASGELAALTITDALARLQKGVIRAESLKEESFNEGLLEYPHYTRPEVFEGMVVPSVLLSGHHQKISDWRYQQRLQRTAKRRADLLTAAGKSV